MTKVIANYLPQYHAIPENDKWWGKGYTDWVAVKKSVPLFDGHAQPKKPLNDNYYDLAKIEDIRWQAETAQKYGVYGFGIYHYWFSSNQMLLERPAELIKDNPDINIHYMFIWDNSTWKRTWSNVKGPVNDWAPLFESTDNRIDDGILAPLIYGTEKDWEKHFEYLLPFFLDKRYIYDDGKPLFGIFTQSIDSEILQEMVNCWNQLAKDAGLNGVKVIGRTNSQRINVFGSQFTYQPTWDGWTWQNQYERVRNRLVEQVFKKGKLKIYSYDAIWNRILHRTKTYENQDVFLSGFVNYDDSPRRGMNSRIIIGSSPDKFCKYMEKLLRESERQGKDFVFLTAWNEWGEGAYLEPDTSDGFSYLEALKMAIENAKR